MNVFHFTSFLLWLKIFRSYADHQHQCKLLISISRQKCFSFGNALKIFRVIGVLFLKCAHNWFMLSIWFTKRGRRNIRSHFKCDRFIDQVNFLINCFMKWTRSTNDFLFKYQISNINIKQTKNLNNNKKFATENKDWRKKLNYSNQIVNTYICDVYLEENSN